MLKNLLKNKDRLWNMQQLTSFNFLANHNENGEKRKRSKNIFTKNKTKANNPCVKSCANIRLSLVTWNISDLTRNYDLKVQFSTNKSIFFVLISPLTNWKKAIEKKTKVIRKKAGIKESDIISLYMIPNIQKYSLINLWRIIYVYR